MSEATAPLPAADPQQGETPSTPTAVSRSSMLGGRAIALVGAALLIDAAVETTWSGSPVRWWALGAAVLSVAAVALTWRARIGWRSRFGIAGVVLLGLLAATAWSPAGLTDGVRLLRQPTATVFSGATVAVLVVAAAALLRASAVPAAARLIAALLALYGLGAFGLGAWQATAYPALFSGASLWQAAPRWLQGSIVGGLVALPLALLVSLAGGLRRGGRVWRPLEIVSLGLALAVVGSGLATSAAPAQPGTPPASAAAAVSAGIPGATSPPPAASPIAPGDPALRARYSNRFRAAAAIARSAANAAPRDHDDPAAVLKATGNDPSAILDWVKSETRLIAYAGTLRGASGVLMDRAGNSLDRALLLADLLRRAGSTVRLARAGVSPQIATALRSSMVAAVPRPMPPVTPDRDTLLRSSEASPQLDSALLGRAVDATLTDHERFASTVRELYDRVLPALVRAVGEDAGRDQAITADAEARLRDHFWVQRQVGGGWEDLDPDAAIVGSLAASTTFAPEAIPADLKHQVTLRVIVESWREGKLSETSLLERTLDPADLIGKSLTLSHRVFPEPPLDQIANNNDPQQAYVTALSQAWVIEPVLTVAGEQATARLFTLRGEVLSATPQTLGDLGVAGGPPGGFASGLSNLFGGGGKPTPAGPPDESAGPVRISAEWLEFEIKIPDRPPERHRRAVFDLLGPAARASGAAPQVDSAGRERRALSLAGNTDILVFGATPAESWIRRVAGEGLAAAAEQAAVGEDSARSPLEAMSNQPSSRLELPLWGWALNRTRSRDLPPASPVSPNVALLWQTPVHERGQPNTVKTVFDIVTNGAVQDLSFAHRVAQGVLDTAVEHAILKSNGPGDNTAALQALDLAAGRSWVRLDAGDPGAVDRLAVPPDAKALMKGDLARGNVVIARPQGGAVPGQGAASWWRIDPRTGATLGIGETGMGQAMPERALVAQVVLGSLCSFYVLGEHISAKNVALFSFCAGGAILGPMGAAAAVTEGVVDLVVHILLAPEQGEE